MDGRWTSAKGMYTRLTSMEIRHLAEGEAAPLHELLAAVFAIPITPPRCPPLHDRLH